MLSQEDLINIVIPLIINEGKRYEKYRKVYAREAKEGEKITTTTSDGLETENVAQKGDYILRNQTDAKEVYILKSEKFIQRYLLIGDGIDGFKEYRPMGQVLALEMTEEHMKKLGFEEKGYFLAPWGYKMLINTLDFLVCPLDFSEVYRVARKEFFETYRLKG